MSDAALSRVWRRFEDFGVAAREVVCKLALNDHWLKNVEENVARCRLCGTVLLCGHATDDQVRRYLGVR